MMLIRSRCKLFDVRVSGSPFFSTEASVPFSALETQILKTGDPRIPVTPILNHWLQQGRDATQMDLQRLISRLCDFRRFTHALQVSEWMSNERKCSLTPGDIANRLNLLSKVHGLEQAEGFFRTIPDSEIGFKIYAALLRCYVKHKSLKEAEDVMKKIKKLRGVNLTVCYNMMLKLYANLGQYEKVDNLMQEMTRNDICNGATFTIRLNAYVATTDIKGMEKLLMRMEADPTATIDWYIYTTAANGYLKAGNLEKALVALKKSEQLARRSRTMRFAYESLLTMYASIGNKEEVYRLWDRLKNLRPHNSSYVCMLSSLVKLGDIAEAETFLEEWESKCTHFDTRIPNLMITTYCKEGMVEKAEAYIRKLLDSGKEINGRTWERLAAGYHMDNHMEKAVQTMKKAISDKQVPGWRPNPFTLAACLDHAKERGDLESVLEIIKFCREGGHISVHTNDRLVSYIHSEIPDAKALDLIKVDYQLDEKITS